PAPHAAAPVGRKAAEPKAPAQVAEPTALICGKVLDAAGHPLPLAAVTALVRRPFRPGEQALRDEGASDSTSRSGKPSHDDKCTYLPVTPGSAAAAVGTPPPPATVDPSGRVGAGHRSGCVHATDRPRPAPTDRATGD